MKLLVTGAAGFIGTHLIYELVKRDVIDKLSDYYGNRLKLAVVASRHQAFNTGTMCTSQLFPTCRFQKVDIADKVLLYRLFHEGNLIR